MLAGVAIAAAAQETRRIGVLYTGSQARISSAERVLFETLRDRGFVEGNNLIITRRYADGDMKRLVAYADEMATLKPEVVVTMCTPSTRAMSTASTSIPIVMGMISDPVGQQLVASLAHPGHNVTGSANLYEEVVPKMLEALAGVLPKEARVAALTNPANVAHQRLGPIAEAAAKRLHLDLRRYDVAGPADIPGVLESMAPNRTDAIIIFPDDPMLIGAGALINEFAMRYRLPTMYSQRELVESGGLLSYGTSFAEGYRQAGLYVERILKGAKPADLPVSQPTQIELTINMKTARTIGVTVPDALRVRADRLIE
ncbi:MAG TPA: ABC transporter substrate-binding protein [Albitalea sp.]|nr:ABC transporter substrate-binding protein [Albitalea sp.]